MNKAFILLLCFYVLIAQAEQEAKPLLIPGKTALYQRVLIMPDTALKNDAGGKTIRHLIPFSAFYIYERKKLRGEEWLLLGSDKHGQIEGWVAAEDTIDWHQGLTVVFNNPVGHDRVLLFRDQQSLQAVIDHKQQYEQLYQQAINQQLPPDSPVVAIQPPGYIDIRKNFYLVPILDYRETWLDSEQARMLKVASIPLRQSQPKFQKNGATEQETINAGIVFVIDASLSMDKYIKRTREAVKKVYDQLAAANQLGRVNFGLVAFRDNTQAVPQLEYVSKTIVDLQEGHDPQVFLKKVASLSAAKVSSRHFREDAYAGIREAIESMDWSPFQARYIVLITDARAREGQDPLSTTGLSTQALRQIALDNGIAIFVMHLLTPSKYANHRRAEKQYRQLSYFPGIGSLYYAVPTGDVKEFGRVLDQLAQQISAQVIGAQDAQQLPSDPEEQQRISELQSKVAKLGYALRMQYLASEEQLPRVFNAWLLDRDFHRPEQKTVDIRILLTRDQLSELHDVLKQVLETAQRGLLSPQSFLDELKSLAATLSRDPTELGQTTATTAGQGNSLADLGLIGDYIEGLPYRSEVMNISLEDWQSWPARRQIEFLRRLEDKITYYRILHDNTDLWVSLDGGPIDGDSVFPISLDMLP